jgi:hypothetical protein
MAATQPVSPCLPRPDQVSLHLHRHPPPSTRPFPGPVGRRQAPPTEPPRAAPPVHVVRSLQVPSVSLVHHNTFAVMRRYFVPGAASCCRPRVAVSTLRRPSSRRSPRSGSHEPPQAVPRPPTGAPGHRGPSSPLPRCQRGLHRLEQRALATPPLFSGIQRKGTTSPLSLCLSLLYDQRA